MPVVSAPYRKYRHLCVFLVENRRKFRRKIVMFIDQYVSLNFHLLPSAQDSSWWQKLVELSKLTFDYVLLTVLDSVFWREAQRNCNEILDCYFFHSN